MFQVETFNAEYVMLQNKVSEQMMAGFVFSSQQKLAEKSGKR